MGVRFGTMHLRNGPIGKGRVVYFNYVGGGMPNDIRPDTTLTRPNETPVSHFSVESSGKTLGIIASTYLENSGVKFGTPAERC